jgi:hypothetical protein
MIKSFNSPAVSTPAATPYNLVCFSFRQEWSVDNTCQHPFLQTYSNTLQSALDLQSLFKYS